jgi:hypothetical protein
MEEFASLIRKPKSRYERRLVQKDLLKIEAIFKPIEESFIVDVFTSHRSYEDSYKEFSEAFFRNCEWISKERKFPLFKINENYFANCYKPEL